MESYYTIDAVYSLDAAILEPHGYRPTAGVDIDIFFADATDYDIRSCSVGGTSPGFEFKTAEPSVGRPFRQQGLYLIVVSRRSPMFLVATFSAFGRLPGGGGRFLFFPATSGSSPAAASTPSWSLCGRFGSPGALCRSASLRGACLFQLCLLSDSRGRHREWRTHQSDHSCG